MPNALADLMGPSHGLIELPRSLEWSSDRMFDLDDDSDFRLLYETVLREARNPADLERFLNSPLLLRE